MEHQGVIYILTNPSFPEYVKIGYADDIDKRLHEELWISEESCYVAERESALYDIHAAYDADEHIGYVADEI